MLELRLLALMLVLEEEQVDLGELALKREGEVDETDCPTSINSDLSPQMTQTQTSPPPDCAHNPPRSPRLT